MKKIHFIGIKGIGMAPLAVIAKEAGFEVSGCDISERFISDEILEKAGIKVLEGFDKSHIKGMDLVITTSAHKGFDNTENIEAKTLSIPILTQGEAVGRFMDGKILKREFEGIAVTGTHGKTTVTAMIATVLKESNLDPSFLVGTGIVPSLGTSGHLGKGKFFVAEADEYSTEPTYDKTPKFLWQKAKVGVLTNIEFDHPDVYSSLSQLTAAFLRFADNLKESLVTCIDNLEVQKLLESFKGRVITYGFSKNADYVLERVSISEQKTFFWVSANGTSLGEFSVDVSGEHNALNATSVIAVCLELGISIENIKKGLSKFSGTKRRFEYIKTLQNGVMVFDDYAHHPTEIKKTLEAFRKAYPKKKILCIFQPHTYSRTKALFNEFSESFKLVDTLILIDIYSSLREEIDPEVSSKLLAEDILKRQKNVLYMENRQDVIKYLGENPLGRDYIVLTMGAGDVYKISDDLT